MPKICLFLVTIFLTNLVIAHEDEHKHDENHAFEEHSSHVHGQAKADISYADNILKINLSLPAIDVFGFEHSPQNDEQHKTITRSTQTLENVNNVFRLEENNLCSLESVNISSDMSSETEKDKHQESSDHASEEHNNKQHSDVIAVYAFKCTDKLEAIEYLIFDHFPTLEVIEVQFISNDHQALFKASSNNRLQALR